MFISSRAAHARCERQRHFRKQFAAHFLARRLVKPVEEIAAGGRFPKQRVGGVAGPCEVCFELIDARHAVPPPAAKADRAGATDGAFSGRQRETGRALHEPRVVANQGHVQSPQARDGELRGQAGAPDATPFPHGKAPAIETPIIYIVHMYMLFCQWFGGNNQFFRDLQIQKGSMLALTKYATTKKGKTASSRRTPRR